MRLSIVFGVYSVVAVTALAVTLHTLFNSVILPQGQKLHDLPGVN